MIPLFLIPVITWWIIQCIKVLIDLCIDKKITRWSLWSAGGFPSVHSWIAASISTLMLLVHWIESTEFAISFTFSFLFWYDAANIRYEAGKHASFLNTISQELSTLSSIITDSKQRKQAVQHLKERLWHTVSEVIWGIIIGSVITFLLYTRTLRYWMLGV